MSPPTMASALKQEQPSVYHAHPTYSSLSSYLNRPLPALPTHTPKHDDPATTCLPTRADRVLPSMALTFSTDDENFDVVAFHRSAALMLAGPLRNPLEGRAISAESREHPRSRLSCQSTQDEVVPEESTAQPCSDKLPSAENDATLPDADSSAVSQQFWIYDGDHSWHRSPNATAEAGSANRDDLLERLSNVMSCVTQPGFRPSSIQCELCGDSFDDDLSEDFANHIGQHSLDFAEKRHECEECQISFASARDLQRHLQSALLTQHCGLNFIHAQTDGNDESCCNGHHPPSYFKTCLSSDHDLMEQHLWAWESSQLRAHRRIVAGVLAAKLSCQEDAELPTFATFLSSPSIISASSVSSYSNSPPSTSIPALQFSSRSKRAPIIPQDSCRHSAAFSFISSSRASSLCVPEITDACYDSNTEQDSTRCDSMLVDDFLYQQTLLNIYSDSLLYKDRDVESISIHHYADEEYARPDSEVLPKHSAPHKPIIATFFSSGKRSPFSSRPSTSSLSSGSTSTDASKERMPQQSSLRNLARFYHRKTRNKLALAGALYGSSPASSSSSLAGNSDEFQHTSHSMSRLHASA